MWHVLHQFPRRALLHGPRERVEDNAVERPLYLLWPRQHVDAVVCRPVVQHRYGDVGVVLQGIHELLPTKRMHLIDDIRLEALPVALGVL